MENSSAYGDGETGMERPNPKSPPLAGKSTLVSSGMR